MFAPNDLRSAMAAVLPESPADRDAVHAYLCALALQATSRRAALLSLEGRWSAAAAASCAAGKLASALAACPATASSPPPTPLASFYLHRPCGDDSRAAAAGDAGDADDAAPPPFAAVFRAATEAAGRCAAFAAAEDAFLAYAGGTEDAASSPALAEAAAALLKTSLAVVLRGAAAASAAGRVLSVAGSDSSGGAGVQADLKALEAAGAFGMTALTALTAQNTTGVQGVHAVPAAFVLAQIESCAGDVGVDAVKTGMLPSPECVEVLAGWLRGRERKVPVVVDPVMVSASGCSLASSATVRAMAAHLLPEATLVTPNLIEARAFLDAESESLEQLLGAAGPSGAAAAMEDVARRLHAQLGTEYVLLKGGHMDEVYPRETTRVSTDVLLHGPTGRLWRLESPWVDTASTHGTGCTLAATIAGYLAQGCGVVDAVCQAKQYIATTLRRSADVKLGEGPHGPMMHNPFF
eukprot:Rhum_TRINITY_DN12049_c0_g1::Rhum_TRINITY_DN12049_c0_g1_i1::g.48732::m.48732